MITLLCTDITIDKEDILRIYANRWDIEVVFKVSKDLLNLNKEFKALSFDMIISHISIVFTRYMILEYIIKKNTRIHQILNKKPVLVL